MNKVKIRLIGERPKETPKGINIPVDWVIFNAPRPLYGDVCWEGDFRHGVFYSAVDSEGDFSDLWIDRNFELDAWEISYIDADIAINEAAEYYRENFPNLKFDPESKRKELLKTWFNLERKRVGLEYDL